MHIHEFGEWSFLQSTEGLCVCVFVWMLKYQKPFYRISGFPVSGIFSHSVTLFIQTFVSRDFYVAGHFLNALVVLLLVTALFGY